MATKKLEIKKLFGCHVDHYLCYLADMSKFLGVSIIRFRILKFRPYWPSLLLRARDNENRDAANKIRVVL